MARRAHRDRGVFVCVQRVDLAIRFTHRVDVRLARLRTLSDATQTILPRLHGHDRAVLFHTCFKLLPRAGSITRHHKLVVTRQHKLHWRFGLFREAAREHSFNADAELGSETAAHVFDTRSHGALRQTEFFRGVGGNRKRALRRSVDRGFVARSEEHTSESSHGYISYAVFCLKKKKI